MPQILDGDKYLWQALGSGLWPIMVLVSEIVQVGKIECACVCVAGRGGAVRAALDGWEDVRMLHIML